MSKSKVLRIVNIILFVAIVNQIVGGYIYGEFSHGLFVWLHKRAAVVLIIAALAHVYLNWNWIVNNYFKSKKS